MSGTNGRVKKNISSDLSPMMLDALLYGARTGFQGTVKTTRRTEDALIKRGLITYDHNVTDDRGDRWIYPVITAKGWTFLWETNKVTRPADDGRLPIGSALAEAYKTGPVVKDFPESWTQALDRAAHRPYGRFPAGVPGRIIAELGKRGLAVLAPVRSNANWDLMVGYDFCLTPSGWLAVNLERPADDGRLTVEQALKIAYPEDFRGRRELGQIAAGGMAVTYLDQVIEQGYLVELTWKASGDKAVGYVESISDDSISIRRDGPGTAYTGAYRRVLKIRVLATREERLRGVGLGERLTLEQALEEAYPAEATTAVEKVERALTGAGFGKNVRISLYVSGFVLVNLDDDRVKVTWKIGEEFDRLPSQEFVDSARTRMVGLYASTLRGAGFDILERRNGHLIIRTGVRTA